MIHQAGFERTGCAPRQIRAEVEQQLGWGPQGAAWTTDQCREGVVGKVRPARIEEQKQRDVRRSVNDERQMLQHIVRQRLGTHSSSAILSHHGSQLFEVRRVLLHQDRLDGRPRRALRRPQDQLGGPWSAIWVATAPSEAVHDDDPPALGLGARHLGEGQYVVFEKFVLEDRLRTLLVQQSG
jgi:hypothetical protein